MLFRFRKLNLRRCLVPEGHYMRGSEGHSFDEGPVREVYISAFEMASTPVTNRDYNTFLKKTKSDPPPWKEDPGFSGLDQPVVGVNWHEACRYCDWLGEESGYKIRLPTEAEWEKAARGGHRGLLFPWGNNPSGGGVPLEGPLPAPNPVSTGRPNGYGLHDMAFNVLQWCMDGYDPEFYRESSAENPVGPDSGEQRVARGASWNSRTLVARCAARSRLAPYFRCNDYGFRWIRTF